MFLSSIGLSFFCFLFFLVFDMPLTGKCYLLVFPEEGERSAHLYRIETGKREERSPTSRGIENVVLLHAVSFSVVCKQPCSDMSWEVSGEVPYNIKRVPFHSSLNVSAWRSGTARSLFSLLVCYAWKQGGEKLSFFLGNPVCDKFLYKVSHVEMPYP